MTFAQHAMADSHLAVEHAEPQPEHATLRAPVAGLMLVALLSAGFWMGILAGVSYLIGEPLTLRMLVATGAVIAAFLTVVCSALTQRSSEAHDVVA